MLRRHLTTVTLPCVQKLRLVSCKTCHVQGFDGSWMLAACTVCRTKAQSKGAAQADTSGWGNISICGQGAAP